MKKISFEADNPKSRYPKVEVGQYYMDRNGYIYRVCRYDLELTNTPWKYVLFLIKPRSTVHEHNRYNWWVAPVSDIDLIFGNNRESFELLESGKIIIEI